MNSFNTKLILAVLLLVFNFMAFSKSKPSDKPLNPLCSGTGVIKCQQFDGAATDWTFTDAGSGAISSGTATYQSANKFVSGLHGYEINNGTATMLFDNINTSIYNNVSLTFRLASLSATSSNGADGTDFVRIDISTDGGTSWSEELIINGNGNAKWTFSSGMGEAQVNYDGNNSATTIQPAAGGNRTTDGYSTITVNNLPQVASMRIRISMKNNSTGEFWVIDDLQLKGTSVGTDPVISNFVPKKGFMGSLITITGVNFKHGTGTSAVRFHNGLSSEFEVVSDTEILAKVPNGTTNGKISVITNGVTGLSNDDFEMTPDSGAPVCTGGTATDLIISEYVEGSTTGNKAIELFNGTGATINLSTYSLDLYSNGANTASNTVSLSGNIPNNTTYVICNGSFSDLSKCDATNNSVINFNGDDVIVLRKNGNIIDSFGTIGNANNNNYAEDHTYIRKPEKIQGVTNSSNFNLANDWNEKNDNDISNLENHLAYIGVSVDKPIITSQPVDRAVDASGASQSITFSVVSSTAGVSYQWKKLVGQNWVNVDNSIDGGVHSGYTTSTLSVLVVESGNGARYKDQFYCQVMNNSRTTCYTNSAVAFVLDSKKFDTTLPVTLANFTVNEQNNQAVLNWETFSERNNMGFFIEKSIDGKVFNEIGFVTGHGTTTEATSYQFVDKKFYQGAYYRFKQMDFNGQTEYFKIIFLKKSLVNLTEKIIIYPNPSSRNEDIKIATNFSVLDVIILDENGKMLFNNRVKIDVLRQELNKLKPGVYSIQISNEHLLQTNKLIVR